MSLLTSLCRLYAHWSRMMQQGNRGWPSNLSRWWPSWVWRAEDRTSQGALGRHPIRNRAVPERRPVPIFFHHVTSSLHLWKMTSSLSFSLVPPTQEIFLFYSSTLLHRLVYLNLSEGWFGAEGAVSHGAMWEILQLHHRERAFKGWLLESWPYWHTSVPLLEEKRGKKLFYVAFKNLHW